MKHIIISIILALTLSSCGIYTSFKGAELSHNPETLYRNIDFSKDTNSIAQIHWKEFFNDTTLHNLIEIGLKNNSDLQIALLKSEEAKVNLLGAKLAYLPTLSLSPQAGIGAQDFSFMDPNYSITASASWEIDIFGKKTNAKRASKAAYESSQAYVQAVQTNLISTIANNYFSLLMLDEQIKISERSIKNWENTIRVMLALKRNGKIKESAISQARGNKLGLESSLKALQAKVLETENNLSTLLGIEASSIQRTCLESQVFENDITLGIPLQMIANRPDVRQAELALAQSFYTVNGSRAALYPSLTLSGSLGFANALGAAVANPWGFVLNSLASVVQPIFNQGRLRAQLSIAQLKEEQSLISFNQVVLDAANEVNNSLIQYQTASERLNIGLEQVASLEKALKSTQLLLLNSNQINYLEVITAENTLLQSELNVVNEKFAQLQGMINLYRALGAKI